MQNQQNIDPRQVSELLRKLNIDPSASHSADMERSIEKKLSPQQADALHRILSDEKKTQQILNTPQAQKLMKLLFKEK